MSLEFSVFDETDSVVMCDACGEKLRFVGRKVGPGGPKYCL